MNTNINESGRYRRPRHLSNNQMRTSPLDNERMEQEDDVQDAITDILNARADGRSDGALNTYKRGLAGFKTRDEREEYDKEFFDKSDWEWDDENELDNYNPLIDDRYESEHGL